MLKRRKFFQGRSIRGAGVKDLAWLSPDGTEVTDQQWNSGSLPCLGVRLNGEMVDEFDERGRRIVGETLLILLNSRGDDIDFLMPTHHPHERWVPIVDTSKNHPANIWLAESEPYFLKGRSLSVLQLRRGWGRLRNLLHTPHRGPATPKSDRA